MNMNDCIDLANRITRDHLTGAPITEDEAQALGMEITARGFADAGAAIFAALNVNGYGARTDRVRWAIIDARDAIRAAAFAKR